MRKLFVLAVAALSAFAAQAQADYPTAPIRIINISSPGAGGDAIARMLAEKMSPIVKGTFIMDNRPGAGGAIAADAGAKAKPDGYTLLFGGFTSHVLLAAVRPNLSYDPAKDFDPVGQIGTASILLIATNDFPANNLKEFIAQAKKAPDSIQYASWGVGSTGHFCGELLNQRAQIKTSHVPYKSVTQIQQDILGGQIKVAFVDMASGTPMVKGGRVKALGSCLERSPSLPDVGSYDDVGIGFAGKSVALPMWALYAPAGTPKPIMDKLSGALRQVVDMPEVKEKLLGYGVKAEFVPGDQLKKLLVGGIPEWREIARKSNIVIE